MTLLIYVNINWALSLDLNHDNHNKHDNNGVTAQPQPPPQLANNNNNKGRSTVVNEKRAQTTRLMLSGP